MNSSQGRGGEQSKGRGKEGRMGHGTSRGVGVSHTRSPPTPSIGQITRCHPTFSGPVGESRLYFLTQRVTSGSKGENVSKCDL